jgi:hypothetical protein
MVFRPLESEIDRLYQLPPDEFTAARNALAKHAGADAAEVRRLARPPIAAWAVNQLFWKQRDVYDALVEASTELRQAHEAVLAGRGGDLRAAGRIHDEALDTALKAALAILKEAGHPLSDSTRQAIVTTLRALPSNEPAGRLTRVLQPGGFEMLAGLSIGGTRQPEREKPAPAARAEAGRAKAAPRGTAAGKDQPAAPEPTAAEKRARADAVARARESAGKADRELRAAEHAAQRMEFEAARTAREAEKAVKQVGLARDALAAAQETLEAAEAAAAAAERDRAAAERRSEEAAEGVDAARRRAKAAREALESALPASGGHSKARR